jgi:ammonium transporter Rh
VYPSIIIGLIAGAISAVGFLRINPYLKTKINLSDTCGVLYLHGIPSIFGWIVSIFAAIEMKNFNMADS